MGTNSFVNLPTVSVGYAATVLAASPAELASFVTLGPLTEGGYQNGQVAIVAAMRPNGGPAMYVLQSAISVSPDSFFVVPTLDDPTRQWVYISILEQGQLTTYTVEIDLVNPPSSIVIVPPINYKALVQKLVSIVITQKDGTITTGPTASWGTDTNASNGAPLQAQSSWTSLTVGGSGGVFGSQVQVNDADLSAHGLRAIFTAGAVLGSATVFKAKFFAICLLSHG